MRLVLLAAGWTAGVYLATLVDIPAIGMFAVLAEALVLALVLRLRARPVLPAVVMALIALGALRASAGMGGEMAPPIQTYNGQDSVAVQGVVVSDPDRRSSGWHFRLAVERVLLGDDWHESQGGLLVTARPPAAMVETGRDPLLRYGDRLVVTGEVEQPEAFQDFDYRDYLARQGVHSVMLYPRLALAGEGEGNPQLGGVYRLRYRLSQSLSQSLSEPQGAMAQAILLGIRSAIPSDLVRAFRETGTSHLLAISGLHVGVFLALSLAASRFVFGARGRVYVLAPLAAVWMYAALSGMSPSVQRAAIMGSVYLAGLYLGRQNSGMPALAAAAAVMVGLSPAILTSVSFQLSFTAMAGLVLLSPPIERRLQLALPAGPERPWSRELTFADRGISGGHAGNTPAGGLLLPLRFSGEPSCHAAGHSRNAANPGLRAPYVGAWLVGRERSAAGGLDRVAVPLVPEAGGGAVRRHTGLGRPRGLDGRAPRGGLLRGAGGRDDAAPDVRDASLGSLSIRAAGNAGSSGGRSWPARRPGSLVHSRSDAAGDCSHLERSPRTSRRAPTRHSLGRGPGRLDIHRYPRRQAGAGRRRAGPKAPAEPARRAHAVLGPEP